MQRWKKVGRVFHVASQYPWMQSHAAVPTVDIIKDDLVRVYFGTRDAQKRGSIGFFEIRLSAPKEILRVSEKPVLSPGELGTFDDSGVLPSWITLNNGKKYLYYIGWNLGVTVPFRNFTGLAVSSDSESPSFQRYSRAPIADRDEADPFFFTNPCFLKDGDLWKIWYLSAVRWEKTESQPKHFYHIKYDESKDGIHWKRTPEVAIDFQYPNEFAISRPCVLKENNTYKMWYSYRGGPDHETYRIGYAESTDGHRWKRKDEEVGLTVSKEGWDSTSIEYAHVFDFNGTRYLFYNGNNFGETGIGLAILERE